MKKISSDKLAKSLRIRPARALEATLKAKLISAVLVAIERRSLTHVELARRSGIPRSAVTGILNGSLQKVSLDRILRLVEAARLTADIKVREAA